MAPKHTISSFHLLNPIEGANNPSCASNKDASAIPPLSTCVPPAGGDVVMTSIDGVEFLAHSDMLRCSSSVFADMFSIATSQDKAIQLTDDTESISLMLWSIYPPKILQIDSFSKLEKSLRIAEKYNIEAIPKAIDYVLSHQLHNDLLLVDPFRIFRISISYRLQETVSAAAKIIQRQEHYFQTQEGVTKLAKYFSDIVPVVSLLGTTGIRVKILHDVLYDFSSGLPSPNLGIDPDPEELSNLLCTTCYKHIKYSNRYPDLKFRPHWLFDWARLAFSEISCKDLDECDDLFKAEVFVRISVGSDYPCCIGEVSGHRGTFETWAQNVKIKLINEFSKLDQLYPL